VKDLKTYKAPFDVYLPATKVDPNTGLAIDAKYLKTIMVDVYDNFGYQMLTEQAHIDIDREKILGMVAMLIHDDMWMDIPNPHLDNRKPIDMIDNIRDQNKLIKFLLKIIKDDQTN